MNSLVLMDFMGHEQALRVQSQPRVAYIMSRFPKLTETFILNEILALERLGQEVAIYPLLREREPTVHPAAARLVDRAHYTPTFSADVLVSQLRFLARHPVAYVRSLAAVLRGNFGSPRLLGAGLLFFPKIVHIARLMAGSGVQHVHCHFATHPALAGFVIQRLTGITYSFTAHGSDIHRDRHMLCTKVNEAAFVVAIAEANRQVIQSECGSSGRHRIVVVHCGVNVQVFRPRERNSIDPNMPLRLLMVGTLHEVKGQRHLIEACSILQRDGRDFTLELVGDGPDREKLHTLVAQHGLQSRISFAGRLTQAQVAERLEHADVLVAPSVPSRDGRREGIPIVLMEAMACGIPVVASRLSGIPELVSHDVSGFLVEPGDAAEIAGAVKRLAAEPALRRRFGEAGRLTVERDFNLDVNARVLADMFQRVAHL